jgi:hypothetical protein
MSVTRSRMAAGMLVCVPALYGTPAFAQEFQTTLQISPPGGGHCIEVSNRQAAPGQHLQMQDCDSSPAQTFSYDPVSARLRIGGLCVDADNSQPGDLVKLAPCGGLHQAWKLEPKNEFAKFIGLNNQCLDIRYGSTELGAPLQSWACGEAEPNQLWRLQRK